MSPDDWRHDAACLDAPLNLFFPTSSADAAYYYPLAMEYCGRCPVKAQCLAFALKGPEHDGLFGGYTPDQRASLRRRDSRRAAKR